MFLAPGWVDALSLTYIPEPLIKKCSLDRCTHKIDCKHIYQVKEIASGISMKRSIVDAKTRPCLLFRDYIKVLKSAEHERLPDIIPHVVIKHMIARITISIKGILKYL